MRDSAADGTGRGLMEAAWAGGAGRSGADRWRSRLPEAEADAPPARGGEPDRAPPKTPTGRPEDEKLSARDLSCSDQL